MIDGVGMLNQNNALNQDPFYPARGAVPQTDQCLSHPTPNVFDYHYHSMSPCVMSANYPQGNIVLCTAYTPCATSARDYMLSGLTQYRNLTVVGLGRDGHVIYGPYNATGQRVTSGVDVCNGASC